MVGGGLGCGLVWVLSGLVARINVLDQITDLGLHISRQLAQIAILAHGLELDQLVEPQRDRLDLEIVGEGVVPDACRDDVEHAEDRRLVALSLTPDNRGLGTHEQLGLAPCRMLSYLHIPCPYIGIHIVPLPLTWSQIFCT